MASCSFQSQLVSIMEVLAKAAVAEINKRVDDSCAIIRLEMTQSQRDIDVLKRKCRMMESELKKTQGLDRRKVFYPMSTERLSYPVKIVLNKERSSSQWRGRDDSQCQPTDVEQREETEPILIKDEETAEDVWKADPQEELRVTGEESGSKPEQPLSFEQRHCNEDFITQPNISPEDSVKRYLNSDIPEEPGTPRLMSTEISEVFSTEQHRSAEDKDSLDLVMVKDEKEEALDQTTALAGPDQFVMDETDGQLWTSVDPGRDTDPDGHPDFSFHATEEYSQNISIFPSHSGLPSVPTMTDDVGPSLHSSIVKPHANMFSATAHMKRHVRTLADETRQQMPEGESSERLNSNNEGNSSALQPRQHQYGASESTVRLSECMTGSNMASTFSGYSLSRSSFNMVKRMRTQWRSGGTTERRFSCTFCEKSFPRFWQLKEHLRSHTGEKPYTCEQCGRSFTKQCNLIRHAVVHSGEKPYECTQCGKCFTQRSGMKSHQRTHIGESPVSQYVVPTYPGDPHTRLV
ncbi:hypothetical protein J4Q44_G00189700 [Coregonus suidteri]|uniref:C2H2-type domain-containing protein n=1 Tax=Coregonus suidteri TaxID=861788 RepID=A0AAN8LRJ7_9TELE